MSKTILIVDDDKFVRQGLAEVLKKAGLEVVEAADGKEGHEKAAEVQPNLVVTDVRMPKMDGLEMIQALRDDEKTKDLPIIVLTIDDTTTSLNTALAAGVTFYLSKNGVGPDTIAEQVITAVGGTD